MSLHLGKRCDARQERDLDQVRPSETPREQGQARRRASGEKALEDSPAKGARTYSKTSGPARTRSVFFLLLLNQELQRGWRSPQGQRDGRRKEVAAPEMVLREKAAVRGQVPGLPEHPVSPISHDMGS